MLPVLFKSLIQLLWFHFPGSSLINPTNPVVQTPLVSSQCHLTRGVSPSPTTLSRSWPFNLSQPASSHDHYLSPSPPCVSCSLPLASFLRVKVTLSCWLLPTSFRKHMWGWGGDRPMIKQSFSARLLINGNGHILSSSPIYWLPPGQNIVQYLNTLCTSAPPRPLFSTNGVCVCLEVIPLFQVNEQIDIDTWHCQVIKKGWLYIYIFYVSATCVSWLFLLTPFCLLGGWIRSKTWLGLYSW